MNKRNIVYTAKVRVTLLTKKKQSDSSCHYLYFPSQTVRNKSSVVSMAASQQQNSFLSPLTMPHNMTRVWEYPLMKGGFEPISVLREEETCGNIMKVIRARSSKLLDK